MQTGDWALIISICSAVVSSAGFVWNVWSKFIYPKPRISVSFAFMTVLEGARREPHQHILALSATNMGPSELTLYTAIVRGRRKWWSWKRYKHYGLLNPLHNYPASLDDTTGPFSGGFPKKLPVGEQFSAYFIPDHEELAKDQITQVGFHDTFGRNHWCSKKAVRTARPKIRDACDTVGKKYTE
jgi:hypothetical protein